MHEPITIDPTDLIDAVVSTLLEHFSEEREASPVVEPNQARLIAADILSRVSCSPLRSA